MAVAERQRVKDLLTVELRKIQTEITFKEEKMKASAAGEETVSQPQKPTIAQPRVPTVDVKNYGRVFLSKALQRLLLAASLFFYFI